MGIIATTMRIEAFELNLKQLERKNYIISELIGGKYTIDTQSEIGIIDFFPKSNRVLIRKYNKWEDYGLKWIVLNMLN